MAADTKAQAIKDATDEAIGVLRRLRALAEGVLNPVAGDVEPHPETIAALKAKAVFEYGNWDVAKAAVDAAKTA